jgi:hypothetical protein
MDILSCLVGVMLFLVIYTVLELGSTTFQAAIPVVRDTPAEAERVVVLAENDVVRVLDVARPIDELLSGFEIVETFAEVPVFVAANRRRPFDEYFRYTLLYEERLAVDLLGTLDLRVEERGGAVGDSIHQLDESSRYVRAIESLDPAESWLAFVVDSMSVDVFRRARELASARGFAVRWDPGTLDFPLTFALYRDGGEDWFGTTPDVDKPLR